MANVLIDGDGYLKLADFGIAHEIPDEQFINHEAGTYKTMAPEVIKREQYRFMPDWWSVGIVLY